MINIVDEAVSSADDVTRHTKDHNEDVVVVHSFIRSTACSDFCFAFVFVFVFCICSFTRSPRVNKLACVRSSIFMSSKDLLRAAFLRIASHRQQRFLPKYSYSYSNASVCQKSAEINGVICSTHSDGIAKRNNNNSKESIIQKRKKSVSEEKKLECGESIMWIILTKRDTIEKWLNNIERDSWGMIELLRDSSKEK